MFIDIAKIKIVSGKGGDGKVGFHREKYVAAGGPDGGDGGRGGSVIFKVDDNLSTLLDFRYKKKYVAAPGEPGGGKRCKGKDGADLIIRVPRGTIIRDQKTGQVMKDMSDSEPFVAAKGGNGGWGNNPPTYMRTLFSDESKFSGTNPHSMGAIGYSNAEMTALAEGQVYETDFDKRVELFQELELLVSREIPIIVIANQSSYSMYRKDVYDGWMKTYAYQQAEQNRLSYMAR